MLVLLSAGAGIQRKVSEGCDGAVERCGRTMGAASSGHLVAQGQTNVRKAVGTLSFTPKAHDKGLCLVRLRRPAATRSNAAAFRYMASCLRTGVVPLARTFYISYPFFRDVRVHTYLKRYSSVFIGETSREH